MDGDSRFFERGSAISKTACSNNMLDIVGLEELRSNDEHAVANGQCRNKSTSRYFRAFPSVGASKIKKRTARPAGVVNSTRVGAL